MVDSDVRLLLAVFPNDAPEMVRFFGMLMYLIAPTAVALLSVLLGQLHRSHHTAVTREAYREEGCGPRAGSDSTSRRRSWSASTRSMPQSPAPREKLASTPAFSATP